jgi:hypothetical protein
VRDKFAALFALASLLLFVVLAVGWARASTGESVWVRFVGHSLLVHGPSGHGVTSECGAVPGPSPAAAGVAASSGLD